MTTIKLAKQPHAEIICVSCGKKFFIAYNRRDRAIKYCSRECQSDGRRGMRYAKGHQVAVYTDKKPRPCLVCGKMFVTDKFTRVHSACKPRNRAYGI